MRRRIGRVLIIHVNGVRLRSGGGAATVLRAHQQVRPQGSGPRLGVCVCSRGWWVQRSRRGDPSSLQPQCLMCVPSPPSGFASSITSSSVGTFSYSPQPPRGRRRSEAIPPAGRVLRGVLVIVKPLATPCLVSGAGVVSIRHSGETLRACPPNGCRASNGIRSPKVAARDLLPTKVTLLPQN